MLAPGETLVQRDLADTLAAIARDGPRAFYEGADADKIVAAVRAAGGLMTRDDLKNYRPIERGRCAAAIAATTSSRCRRPRPAA